MPKKSLLAGNPLNQLKLKLQSLLSQRRNQNQSRLSQNNLGDPTKSPNLLQNVLELQKLQGREKTQFKISRVAWGLIILIQLLFIFLSLYNARTVIITKNLQTEIKALEANVSSKALAEEKVRTIILRTDFLKELESGRVTYTPRMEAFINGIPSNVFLDHSFVQDNLMSLTVETQSPLEVSLLISNYFNDGFAREVTIQSATLNRSENTFTTTLEVTFDRI